MGTTEEKNDVTDIRRTDDVVGWNQILVDIICSERELLGTLLTRRSVADVIVMGYPIVTDRADTVEEMEMMGLATTAAFSGPKRLNAIRQFDIRDLETTI
jgi:hypothetical protein